jgi:hypothetical protein
MNPFDPAQIEGFKEAARELEDAVERLRWMGIVATVETVPQLPLAMGNHHMKVSYRLGKEIYRPIMEQLVEKGKGHGLEVLA